jgi:hypothetical protein
MNRRIPLALLCLAAWAAASAAGATAAEKAAPAAPPPETAAPAKPAPAETPDKLGVAGKPDPAPFNLGTKEYDGGKLLWESLAAVIVVLALGGAGLFLVRRVVPRIGAARGKQIALVETLHLSPQRSVHLVQVGGRSLLVGASRDGLRLLADVTGAVEPVPAAKPKAKFVIPESPGEAAQ